MDRTACPEKYWLLAFLFMAGLFNCIAWESIGWKTPMEAQDSQVPDISAYLSFYFREPVVFKGPGDRHERQGYWMGPAQDIGDSLCFMILTKDTDKIVYRSNVRSAMTPINKRITPNFDSAEGEIPPTVVHSTLDFDDSTEVKLPVYSPDKILGLSFLRDQDDGTRVRAEVYRKVLDKEAAEHQQIKFILKIGDGELEELISYSALADIIEQQHEEEAQQDPNEKLWTFTGVLDHEGPLKPSDDKYKGSSYNVLVLWDNGKKAWEPLEEFVKDDPLTLAIYAKEHGLLDKPRWKRLMPYARREKK